MFANLKIGTRLTLGFGIVLGLLCLMASVAAWQIGKLADITVFSKDLLTIPEAEIPTTTVRYTIVGGVVQYQAP